MQRATRVTDGTPGQRHLAKRIEFPFENLELGLVLGAVENLEAHYR
jgi:hypothetical protein